MKVFVTVGTRFEPFDRLIETVDEAIDIAGLAGEVRGLCQFGHSRARSRHLENTEALGRVVFGEHAASADVVVSHAGVGAIQTALEHGHTPLVLARRAPVECVNDHQVEIVEVLVRRGLARSFDGARELAPLLALSPRRPPRAGERAELPPELVGSLDRVPRRSALARRHRLILRALAALGPGAARLQYREDAR